MIPIRITVKYLVIPKDGYFQAKGLSLNEDKTRIINYSANTKINNNQTTSTTISSSQSQIAPQQNVNFLSIEIVI